MRAVVFWCVLSLAISAVATYSTATSIPFTRGWCYDAGFAADSWGISVLSFVPISVVRCTTLAMLPINLAAIDLSNSALFRCDSCSKHRLSVAPGTPMGGQNFFTFRGSASPKTVTLGDFMQQHRYSSGVVNSRLSRIEDSVVGMERTMAGIHSDVADLSASHELLTERVAVLEARADIADSDSTRVRVQGFVVRSQLSGFTYCLSSIEASRVSPDISVSGIPASVTDSQDYSSQSIRGSSDS